MVIASIFLKIEDLTLDLNINVYFIIITLF